MGFRHAVLGDIRSQTRNDLPPTFCAGFSAQTNDARVSDSKFPCHVLAVGNRIYGICFGREDVSKISPRMIYARSSTLGSSYRQSQRWCVGTPWFPTRHGSISGLPVIPPTIGQTPNGVPKLPRSNCRGVRTLHLSGSVLVRIYLSTREVDRLQCTFSMGHQKFSICHTFLAPVSSVMASDRPSGDGIAEKTSLRECSSTEALPSRVTFSNVLSPS